MDILVSLLTLDNGKAMKKAIEKLVVYHLAIVCSMLKDEDQSNLFRNQGRSTV